MAAVAYPTIVVPARPRLTTGRPPARPGRGRLPVGTVGTVGTARTV